MSKIKEISIREIKELIYGNGIISVIYTIKELDEQYSFISTMEFISLNEQLKLTKETLHLFPKKQAFNICPLCHKHRLYDRYHTSCSFLSKNKTMLERELQSHIQKHKDRIKLLVAGMRIK